jgi:hypothetical protein
MLINFVKAYEKCAGKYIAFLEGDDFWTDADKLQKQVEFLEANPDYVVCYHNSIVVDENNNIVNESKLSEKNKRDYTPDELIKAYKIQPNTMCLRNKIFQMNFSEHLGEINLLLQYLGHMAKVNI